MSHEIPQRSAGAELILASASPRRRELLDQIGVRYRLQAAALDERQLSGESPGACVQRLALAKAQHVYGLAGAQAVVVLGADTAVVLDGRMLGKPADRADHLRMMSALSGRIHEVLTAVAVVSARGLSVCLSQNKVRLIELSAADADAYWATGEPADKAGGYAVQGRAALFVSDLHGSYSGVMGLPLCETASLLAQHGVLPLWKQRA
jgi:nucleoside triphosphate pyrophosphatase